LRRGQQLFAIRVSAPRLATGFVIAVGLLPVIEKANSYSFSELLKSASDSPARGGDTQPQRCGASENNCRRVRLQETPDDSGKRDQRYAAESGANRIQSRSFASATGAFETSVLLFLPFMFLD
jgi:hypothetical protein